MSQELQGRDFAGAGQAEHDVTEPQRQRDQRHRGDALMPEMTGAGMGGAHAPDLVQGCLSGVHRRYPPWPVQPRAKMATAITIDPTRIIMLLRSARFFSKP